MSIEQTRTCHKCQRENRRENKFCTECGADLEGLRLVPLLFSAGLTAAPLIITPIHMVSSVDEGDAYESFGMVYVWIFMVITFLMAAYAVVMGYVSGVVRRRNRSVARGILVGLWTGLFLGIAACTQSFAAL